ncbi:hypothetical protein PC129_g17093 [Phytophthora cactorum]|uniref:Integrase catalytic domain-containing protein n=1 Tax=Phytophthora cactorum TaxID=29920 RepID=A0A329SJZ3_9STRA|nr:hypothetical protein PC117_g22222 [Phytophthora cactorum]KAG3058255.1 hypothetical protein PC122_g20750 [Phytophthora cactorum]KAG3211939.1 hypothetical protein PC129_g17093 [Phytophthora cactorum]RAW36990.1 hypothetical protein PC110_g6737 [Phytophthora cactorum]
MGKSYGASKYLLVLKDHATYYCELVVSDIAESKVTVKALLAWHSRFGIPPIWVSDNGSHFKNEPWINGSIERINRDILQVMRAMILEYKVSYKDWVYLAPMVQSSLNHTAVPSLGNRAPVELFTGLQRPTPLREFYLPDGSGLQELPASEQIGQYRRHCEIACNRCTVQWTTSVSSSGSSTEKNERHGNKLQVTWIGPYRVTRADTHSFCVQHLVTGEELDVHASRLKLYVDSLDVIDELLEHVSSQGIVLAVDNVKEHKWNTQISDFEILVG